ncbi:uncharacterized protein LOC114273599 [Camellia sinensis]|uniref:uncharacterized protein LOC114273599 n=1 Tax=Camellia sinensis TaxID=4442 RepID=UPI00103635AA|nr:uncharacterized protein LOC114273599 [Camellia sinensis]
MTWTQFNKIFYDKYFPQYFRDQKVSKFQQLKQGNVFIAEYEAKFTELARFAPHIVDTDHKKARKFKGGLDLDVFDRVGVQKLPTYVELLGRALMVEVILATKKQVKAPTTEWKACDIVIVNVTLHVDLLPLEIDHFHCILDMDWLTKYCATIDCVNKSVVFRPLGLPKFVFTRISSTVENISVVNEFPNVFPNELPRDLINRKIKFTIDVILYHPRKANTVADALSQKSVANFSCLLTSQKELLYDLERDGIEIVLPEQGGVLVATYAQPTIIEEIREKQLEDEFLKEIVDAIDSKPRPGFVLDNNVLKFQS